MFLRKNKNLSLTLLLLVGVLLGYTSCVSRNPENSSQDQYTEENTSQGSPTPKKPDKAGNIPLEKALPDSLIARVKDSVLQQHLRELRKNPSQIDAKVTGGRSVVQRTALQLAVIHDELEVVEGLLKAGANPNVIPDQFQYTALSDAARYSKKAIQALLEAGADACWQDFFGNTALHMVAAWENVDKSTHKTTIELLLLAKDSDILINMQNNLGETPLEVAQGCRQDREIIALLERYKQRPSADGQSPLAQVLTGSVIGSVRDRDLRQCLRELRKDPTPINNKGRTNETPLLKAIRNNELKVLQALLQAGADPRAKDNQMALHRAIEEANLEAVEALIAARADINQPGHLHQTPLHTAVQQAVRSRYCQEENAKKIVELLAQQSGIDFYKTDVGGLTPLEMAANNGNQCVADILKQYGATR